METSGSDRAAFVWTAFLAAAMAYVLSTSAAVAARPAPPSFADLAEEVSPAVVNISTTQTIKMDRRNMPQFPEGSPFEEFFEKFFNERGQERERKATSLGSGFIIDSDGVVVTNDHVIQEADEIVVTLNDGTEYEAEVVGRDQATDMAVLRMDAAEGLPTLEFGDSDTARVGEWILAIGNPYGLGGSVTAGIVSARSRDIRMGQYDDFIQTDAAINRGNSGGPLINMNGEVVGVNSAIFSPTGGSVGIGFAIPSNQAQPVVQQLLERGEVQRGWLGVSLQGMNEGLAESLGLDEARGALVAQVIDGDPADQAGMQSGDVILEFDGQMVEGARDLPRIVANTPIGETVEVVVWRNGEEVTLEATLGERPPEDQVAGAPREQGDQDGGPMPAEEFMLGMQLAPLDSQTRQQFEVPSDTDGVVVTDINQDSAAFEQGLRPGMVIVQIGQGSNARQVSEPTEFAAGIAELRKSGRESALLWVFAGGTNRWVAVPLEEEQEDE